MFEKMSSSSSAFRTAWIRSSAALLVARNPALIKRFHANYSTANQMDEVYSALGQNNKGNQGARQELWSLPGIAAFGREVSKLPDSINLLDTIEREQHVSSGGNALALAFTRGTAELRVKVFNVATAEEKVKLVICSKLIALRKLLTASSGSHVDPLHVATVGLRYQVTALIETTLRSSSLCNIKPGEPFTVPPSLITALLLDSFDKMKQLLEPIELNHKTKTSSDDFFSSEGMANLGIIQNTLGPTFELFEVRRYAQLFGAVQLAANIMLNVKESSTRGSLSTP
ncbi:hypothetical protein T492DRAFT_967309 [Pavlovales sp. CCMP2436]|nr:hypothetical protein T492DRAFT_967309 [Pavlovales sp. CCMP2436]